MLTKTAATADDSSSGNQCTFCDKARQQLSDIEKINPPGAYDSSKVFDPEIPTTAYHLPSPSDVAEDLLDGHIESFCQAKDAAHQAALTSREIAEQADRDVETLRETLAIRKKDRDLLCKVSTKRKRAFNEFLLVQDDFEKTIEDRFRAQSKRFDDWWQDCPPLGVFPQGSK